MYAETRTAGGIPGNHSADQSFNDLDLVLLVTIIALAYLYPDGAKRNPGLRMHPVARLFHAAAHHETAAGRLAGETGDIDTLILNKIDQKRNKGGAAYASGKTLVVFLEGGIGPWYPNRVARQPSHLYFTTVWVVGLQWVGEGEYVYGATNLNLTKGNAPPFSVVFGRTSTGGM